MHDPAALITALAIDGSAAAVLDQMQQRAVAIAVDMRSMSPPAMHAMLVLFDLKVVIDGTGIAATADQALLATCLGIMSSNDSGDRCCIKLPGRLLRTGNETRLAIAPQSTGEPKSCDANLVMLIVKAHQARDLLLGQGAVSDQASAISHRHLTRLARLAFLAPEITVAIMEGR